MDEPLTLSHAAVDILWEELALGRLPPPLEIRSVGATMDERAAIRREVWQGLTDRGLAYRGRLEPEVEDQLAVLVRYDSAISVFGALDDGEVLRARVSGNSRFAVLAVQDTESVHFEPVEPRSLSASIVGVLPNARPFPARPVTVREQDPLSSGYLHPVTTPTPDEQEARRMLSCRRERAGYFTVHGRDGRGRHVQAPELAWTDTVKGRFSSQLRTTRGGRQLATHAPATNSSLAGQLRELLAWVHADD
ncbi:MAG TPA: ESX secretion-associated protein EspG [Pseudonocardiaceae bacterium]|jgi:hypothetical protein|nr:ESX secretion-associated protein EspG [Pseudonocardiaceae bacterium]